MTQIKTTKVSLIKLIFVMTRSKVTKLAIQSSSLHKLILIVNEEYVLRKGLHLDSQKVLLNVDYFNLNF